MYFGLFFFTKYDTNMILDKIDNATLYKGMHAGISKALDYIVNADFSELALGKHEIEGDSIFVIMNEYDTKSAEDSLLESHIKCIDVQYIVEGVEQFGITTHFNQKPTKLYNAEDDYMLFNEPYDLITLKKGMFIIFFPDDMHLPGIKIKKTASVKKVVVKVKI